jgi:MinD superfamily P-loop ATPase containing an inserted ferredoxin domain
MIRQMIKIDGEKCDGCGICVDACFEGALAIIEGKAKLVRDDHCDGLGNCLPVCPRGAISFEMREAVPFLEELASPPQISPCSIPLMNANTSNGTLKQWPIKIDLVPSKASFFDGTDLFIAADCTAFALPEFHKTAAGKGSIVIGCPKLDKNDHTEKLTNILMSNDIKSVTVVKMEVPCCGALERIARLALSSSKKDIPIKTVTVSVTGRINE